MRQLTRLRYRSRGFTLVEMAMVLVIVGLLVGSLLGPLSVQVENSQRKETEKVLEEIKEALMGYALVYGRLPCPDTDNDGIENAPCTSPAYGGLPWQQLGIGNRDSWGQSYHYGVDIAFTTIFSLATTGSLKVCDTTPCNSSTSNSLADNLPAVIFSTGKRFTAASADEQENMDGTDNFYIYHTYNDAPGNEFDDLVTWISPHILFNRMVSAGRLP